MPTPITPERLAQWRAAYLRVAGAMAENPDAALIVAEAFPTLIAEVERLQASLAAEEAEVVRFCERAQVRQGDLDLAKSALSVLSVEFETLRSEVRRLRAELAAVSRPPGA